MNDLKKDIIIATGGTGGHIFPAISLADYLNNNGFEPIITTDKRGSKFIDDKHGHKIIIINSSTLSKKNILISVCKVIFAIFNSFCTKSIIFFLAASQRRLGLKILPTVVRGMLSIFG